MTANATGITPTIVQIREDWISAMITPSDYWDAISEEEAEARFARALAAHDAQVLREAAEALPGRTPVRHRVNGWLRERADRIEEEQG